MNRSTIPGKEENTFTVSSWVKSLEGLEALPMKQKKLAGFTEINFLHYAMAMSRESIMVLIFSKTLNFHPILNNIQENHAWKI